jgi:hypothetical protein
MASRPFRSPVLPWLGSGVTKHSQSPTNQPNPKRGVKKQTRSPSWILARNDYCLLYPWLLVVLSSLFPFLVASGCLLLIRGSSSAAESSSLLTRFLRIPFVSRPSFPHSLLRIWKTIWGRLPQLHYLAAAAGVERMNAWIQSQTRPRRTSCLFGKHPPTPTPGKRKSPGRQQRAGVPFVSVELRDHQLD